MHKPIYIMIYYCRHNSNMSEKDDKTLPKRRKKPSWLGRAKWTMGDDDNTQNQSIYQF